MRCYFLKIKEALLYIHIHMELDGTTIVIILSLGFSYRGSGIIFDCISKISIDCGIFCAGKPQRMNGKVHGRVYVGNSPSPVQFSSNDLHSYVVVNDGRSYVAISDIPPSIGPSLLPLPGIGGVIGWAFALEQPGFKNGFSIIGEGQI